MTPSPKRDAAALRFEEISPVRLEVGEIYDTRRSRSKQRCVISEMNASRKEIFMNRRSFAKRSVVACAAVLGSTSSLVVAAEKTRRSAEPKGRTESSREPDVAFEGPIPPGEDNYSWRRVPGRVTVPGFELAGTKLDPDTSKTRACVAVRFRSRSIRFAHVEIELLDNTSEGRVLHRASRTEVCGPLKVVTRTGRGPDKIRHWDDFRAQWFDFPVDARDTAKAIRVKVRFERA